VVEGEVKEAEPHTVNLRGKRAEAEFVGFYPAREGHTKKGSTVEGMLKGYNGFSFSIVPRHLGGVLHSLGTAIYKHGLFEEIARRNLGEFLHKPDIRLVHKKRPLQRIFL